MLFLPEVFLKEVDLDVLGKSTRTAVTHIILIPACVTLTSSYTHAPCLALEFAPHIRFLPPKDSSAFTQRRGHQWCGISRVLASPLCSEIARSLL